MKGSILSFDNQPWIKAISLGIVLTFLLISGSLMPDTARAQSAVFDDVPTDHWAYDEITALYQAGYIAGCSTDPLLYCPDNTLNRSEAAVFVIRGQYGAIGDPPYQPPASPTFSDVASSFWGYGWIESLWTDGFTAGCSTNPLAFCPNRNHSRAEGSVFFLRIKNGPDYAAPSPSGIFTDVDMNAWYAGWVEAAYTQGILPACNQNPLQFCPEDDLNRAWAAYMMVQALGGLPLPTPAPTATPTSTPLPSNGIVVDHTSVDLFESIPESYLQAAADLNMFFMDRSVGININEGLNCLSYPSDESAPSHCTRYEHVDPTFSVSQSELNWSRTGGYDRTNWDFDTWPAANCDSWYNKIDCFIDYIDPSIGNYDVVSYQLSYLAVDDGSSIADSPGGYFYDNTNRTDVFDQENYEAQHPSTTFIYWTTSLARGIGTEVSETFNDQMRQYAISNDKPLFDVADILSHDPDGNPCYDNRDGVPYNNGNNSENYADDGIDRLAICQHYTTETDGGHLGSVSAGKIRVAKGFWVLMAQIAGWDGTP